jgi:hypothetical protein
MTDILDGFWLPAEIREEIISAGTPWTTLYYKDGRPVEEDGPGVVGARWPVLSMDGWERLLELLDRRREAPPADFLERLTKALTAISQRFDDPADPLTQTALGAIPGYTGYAAEMIHFVLGALDLMPLDTLAEIVDLELPDAVQRDYVPFKELGSLDGRVRFYPAGPGGALKRLFPRSRDKAFRMTPRHPERVLGYAAGNVIGTSHLISTLAQVSALIGSGLGAGEVKFPSILVKNSRQEPVFAPLIFSALEEVDPRLTATIALMIWDYEDVGLQKYLISGADLVVAAAADFTIDQIEAVIEHVGTPAHPVRFHQHGHKVSFTTIGGAYLEKNAHISKLDNLQIIHLTTLLAAVDSIFWDQYGCLSSRVHFVEAGSAGAYTPLEYGGFLAEKIRLLSGFLPRGAIPLHGLHTRFEKYAAMAGTGKVQLCSTYDDDFLVVVDSRPWSAANFQVVVNDCIERTIVVRPVEDILEVPRTYLDMLPSRNLQTMNAAIDGPGHTSWSQRFSEFVEGVGERGVTGVRTIGRGAFPQLAYSWDGFLPLDLSMERAAGYFTTVEFENTFEQIIDTYRLYASRVGLGV